MEPVWFGSGSGDDGDGGGGASVYVYPGVVLSEHSTGTDTGPSQRPAAVAAAAAAIASAVATAKAEAEATELVVVRRRPRPRHWQRLARLCRLGVTDIEATRLETWTPAVETQLRLGLVSELRLDWARLEEKQVALLCDAVTARSSPACQLHTLSLQHCDLSRASCRLMAESFRANRHLTHINLSGNDHVGDGVVLAVAGAGLRILCLDECQLVTDASVRHIVKRSKNMLHLSLNYCGISDLSLSMIGRTLIKLKTLHLRWCRDITGEGVQDVVYGCSKLEVLDISGCNNVQDGDFVHKAHCVEIVQ